MVRLFKGLTSHLTINKMDNLWNVKIKW